MGGSTAKWENIATLLVRAKGRRVHVGVFAGQAGATSEVVEIAKIHEFGAPRASIPERSYIRSTLKERKHELAAIMTRVVRAMIAGKLSEQRALELVGAWLAGAVKARITSGPFAPLKPATIARKGSSKPLIDTGQLKNSVTFIITD